MISIDYIILTIIWLIVSVGIIGAYAMSLAKMIMLTHVNGEVATGKFLYPGAINIIGYSFAGFLWGLELRRLFSREGPIQSMRMYWRDHPVKCAMTTFEFFAIWLLLGWIAL